MSRIGEGLGALRDFFGCPLEQIEPVCMSLASRYRYPEWLRGRPKFANLPRRTRDASRHRFETKRVTFLSQVEIIGWICENTKGEWDLHTPSGVIWFNDDADAVAYRLTFD